MIGTSRRAFVGFAASSLLMGAARRAVAEPPKEIRIAVPAVGVGNRPVTGGSAVAIAHLRGAVEEEFKRDGIRVKWSFLRGAGPAANELYANGLTDFSSLGDLPSVVGRAGGLKYQALLAASVRGNACVAVPADSSTKEIGDLRGKRVAVQKGTATHLAAVKILEAVGLAERDVKLINMETNAAKAAVVTGDVDAAVGSVDLLQLRNQGAARIVFTSKGNPKLTSNSLFLGAESFIRQYPQIAQRVVKAVVTSAKWAADHDGDPTPVFQLWTRSGSTFSSYKEDWTGESLKYKLSPLLDPYVVTRYNFQIEQARRLGLIRRSFDFGEMVNPIFLSAALKELQLAGFWQPRDAQSGKPSH